jgi:Tfp pilus assembly protein PilF
MSLYPWIEVKSVKADYDEAANEERLTMNGVAAMSWSLNAGYNAREYETDGGQLGAGRDFKRDAGPHSDAPFAVAFPWYEKSTETVILPQDGNGFRVIGEDVDRTIAGVEYKRSSRIDGGVFEMTASTRSRTAEVSADDAAAAKSAMREVSDVIVRIRAPADYKVTDKELQLRLARTPTLAGEFADRAAAKTLKQDYTGAVQDYDQALKLKPDDAEVLNARCFTRSIENADLKLALDDCNAALDQQPHNAAYLDSRGFAYFRLGDLKNAMIDLNAALDVDPKQSPTLYVRGLVERRLGDRQHGDADVKAALKLDPSLTSTYADYGVS